MTRAHMAGRRAVALACAVVMGCVGEAASSKTPSTASATSSAPSAAPPPGIQPAAPPVSPASPSPVTPDAGSATASPDGGRRDAPGGAFATASVLDDARGKRALVGYRDFMVQFCESLGDAGAQVPKLLASMGLQPDAKLRKTLCAPRPTTAGIAIASGSLLEPGADEVLLAVLTGPSDYGGSTTLAVMRADGDRYRPARFLYLNMLSDEFEAKLRVVTPSGRDALLLCTKRGNMGVYSGNCGFLGQGTYRADATDADSRFAADNQFNVLEVLNCGPAATIATGNVTFHGDRIVIPLDVVESVLKPGGGDAETLRDWPCQKETQRKVTHIDLNFEVNPTAAEGHGQGRMRLLTPVPRHFGDVLGRFL